MKTIYVVVRNYDESTSIVRAFEYEYDAMNCCVHNRIFEPDYNVSFDIVPTELVLE